ncbi:MAG: hypothetical protein KF779_07130 [Hyphomonadaceae bacterium]|nr:hypothetical protein [Hyphomonadaceae bacterium]MCA8885217.1 hypothetical protein [Hyphomonadaceae bacterium]
MMLRVAFVALALVVAGCNQQSSSTDTATNAPQLDSPAPESQPSRTFAAANDAARAVANEITVAVTQEFPDAADADIQERLSLTGGNGLNVSALVTGAISPATQVGGQTLRALLELAVEEPQVLVYRVTEAAGSPGLCAGGAPTFVVVWEPSAPGDASIKILGITGGAPGAGDSRACAMLEYRRS